METIELRAELALSANGEELVNRKFNFAGMAGRRFYGWVSIPKKEGKYPLWLTSKIFK